VDLVAAKFSGLRNKFGERRGCPHGAMVSRESSREVGDEEDVGSSSSVYSSSDDSSAEPK